MEVHGTHFFDAKYANIGVLFGGAAAQFPSAFPQTEFNIEASLLLFDGWGAINRYKAASLEREASQHELNYAEFRLEELVKMKFHQVLAAEEFVKVADQNIQTLEQHLKLAQASLRAGFSTHIDVLRIESQLEEAKAEKLLSSDNVLVAKQELNEVLGVEDSPYQLEGQLPIPNVHVVPIGLKFSVERREDIQAESQKEAAQDRVRVASSSFWSPKILLFGSEQFYKFGNFDPAILPNSAFQNAYAIGVRFSWSLFDGGASIARKAQAENNLKTEHEKVRKTLFISSNQFGVWKRKYIYNTALFYARKSSVEKSTESVRLATAAVRAGTKNHAEVLDAELELFRARAGVIHAQLDAAEALSHLELALGYRL